MISGLPVRIAAVLLAVALLAGCERRSDLTDPPVDLGPFKLGLNIVVADNAQKVPISRDAKPDEWEAALSKAIADRFGRYDGDRFYNIGISVDGYALAPPGIPILLAPKSVLVITANVWDDERQQKLNGAGTQFTIFESLSGEQVIGTGITRTKKQQMAALSYNAAKVIENWFLDHPDWFGPGIPIPDPNAKAAPPVAGEGTAPAAVPVADAAKAATPATPGAGSTVRPRASPVAPAASAGAISITPLAEPQATAPASGPGN